ncbi:MAG: hypothetical protein ABT20_04555 [Rubrivivax sp. SCN 70-15]|nr:MAG: hypothetical protein ABT20_04555 [Rubrivivax sp. SCN 70-15]
MDHYRVISVGANGHALALQDARGRCHVATLLASSPSSWPTLVGPAPSRGFQVLRAEDSGHLFRLIFEQVDCDRRELLERLDSIAAD